MRPSRENSVKSRPQVPSRRLYERLAVAPAAVVLALVWLAPALLTHAPEQRGTLQPLRGKPIRQPSALVRTQQPTQQHGARAAASGVTGVRGAKPEPRLYRRLARIRRARPKPFPFPRAIEPHKRAALTQIPADEVADTEGTVPPAARLPIPRGPRPPGSGSLDVQANFPGIQQTLWNPPDGGLAVGPSHLVTTVNTSIRIADRLGASLLETTLEDWFGLQGGVTAGDPRVLYDHFAGRWLVLGTTFDFDPLASYMMVSVSETGDPTGSWRTYALDFQRTSVGETDDFLDYPTVGLDQQAFYLSGNMFNRFTGAYRGIRLRVYGKQQFYAGAPDVDGTEFDRLGGTETFTLQPCLTFGTPGVEWLAWSDFGRSDRLTCYTLTNPLAPDGPVLGGPYSLQVDRYSIPANAQQRGTRQQLNTGDARVQSAVFSNGSLWIAQHTNQRWRGDDRARTAVRWYEIEPQPAGEGFQLLLRQEGTTGRKKTDFFYPALMPDAGDNVSIVYELAGPGHFPGVGAMARLASDPPGQIPRNVVLAAGQGPFREISPSRRVRWGDYCGIARDPVIPSLTWVEGQLAAGGDRWSTRIAAIRP